MFFHATIIARRVNAYHPCRPRLQSQRRVLQCWNISLGFPNALTISPRADKTEASASIPGMIDPTGRWYKRCTPKVRRKRASGQGSRQDSAHAFSRIGEFLPSGRLVAQPSSATFGCHGLPRGIARKAGLPICGGSKARQGCRYLILITL